MKRKQTSQKSSPQSKIKRQQQLISDDDKLLFLEFVKDVKRLKQDTVVKPRIKRAKTQMTLKMNQEQSNEAFYFSDLYQPLLSQEGALKYSRADVDKYELKKLRRGDYSPELFLDLHGLTQEQAKQEIAALIAACRREHVHCASIMHGYGKHILKRQTPLWLAQHPDIKAFHQAPKELGGDAAILILVEMSQ